MDIILLLMAHGLRHGLFADGNTLPEALAARVLRWKKPELPFIAAIKAPRSVLLVIDQAAINTQVLETIKKMGDIAGHLPILLTHDIRRGGAKDLAKLPKDVMKVHDAATARAMGHNNVRTGKVYNEQEDEALNIHKARLRTTFIDKRLPRAVAAYVPPPRRAFKKMVREIYCEECRQLVYYSPSTTAQQLSRPTLTVWMNQLKINSNATPNTRR
jgi:hypothetical protein